MATADSFVLELGVKSSDLMAGLNRAVEAVDQFANKLEGVGKVLDAFVTRFADFGEAGKKGVNTASKAVKAFSKDANRSSSVVKKSTSDMAKSFEQLKGVLNPLGKTMASIFGVNAMMNIARTGEKFDKFVKRSGLDANLVDALGKATILAGGNQDALNSTVELWTQTGRSFEDYLYTPYRLPNDYLERSRMLKNMKLPPEATAAFQEFGADSLKLMESLKKISITDNQMRTARNFTQTFQLLKMYVEDIGRQFGEIVFPIVTNVMRRCIAFFEVLKQNPKETRKILTIIATLLGAKILWTLGKIFLAVTRIVPLLFATKKVLKAIALLGTGRKALVLLGLLIPPLGAVLKLLWGIKGAIKAATTAGAFKGALGFLMRFTKGGLILSAVLLGIYFIIKDIFDYLSGKDSVIGSILDKFNAIKETIKSLIELIRGVPFEDEKASQKNEEKDKASKEKAPEKKKDVEYALPKNDGQRILSQVEENAQAVSKEKDSKAEQKKESAISKENIVNPEYKAEVKGPRFFENETRQKATEKLLAKTGEFLLAKKKESDKTIELTKSFVGWIPEGVKNLFSPLLGVTEEIGKDVGDGLSDRANRLFGPLQGNVQNDTMYSPLWKALGIRNLDDDPRITFAQSVAAQRASNNTSNYTNAPVQTVNITNELNYSGNSSEDDVMRGVSRAMTRNSVNIQRMLGVANTGTCVK